MSRLLMLTAGVALGMASPISSQERPAPPKFTTATELVRVDFVVSDKAGRLVPGLTAKDCVVKEDGKERPIVSFEAFAGAAAPNVTPDPSDSVTAPPVARLIKSSTVLLIDDVHLSPEQLAIARPALKKLLTGVAERSGLLALVAPGSSVTIAGELPGTATQLAAGIDGIAGKRLDDHSSFPVLDAEAMAINRGDLQVLARVTARFLLLNPTLNADQADMIAHSRSTDVEFQARKRRETLLATALEALNWLSDKPGRHSVILVSGGFARDPLDSQQAALVTRSLQVNAPIHFLDARGLSGFGMFQGAQFGVALGRNADEGPYARDEAVEGSSYLADDTGGAIVHNTNDLEKGLAGMLDATQNYYVIGYEAPPHSKRGFHKIEVQLRTKGLNVRARRGYYDAPPGSR